MYQNCVVASCVSGNTIQRYFYPVLMGGFLTQCYTWLGRNRMICSCGTQFELLIEWKGYVQWALSIVSLSLRCAETVMKSSWTHSQRSCDRSSGGCHFAFAGHITHIHTCTHTHAHPRVHPGQTANTELKMKPSLIYFYFHVLSINMNNVWSLCLYWEIKNPPLVCLYLLLRFLFILEIRNFICFTTLCKTQVREI